MHQRHLCFSLANVVDDFYASCSQLSRRMQDSADRATTSASNEEEDEFEKLLKMRKESRKPPEKSALDEFRVKIFYDCAAIEALS